VCSIFARYNNTKNKLFYRLDYLKNKIRIMDVKTAFIVPVLIK